MGAIGTVGHLVCQSGIQGMYPLSTVLVGTAGMFLCSKLSEKEENSTFKKYFMFGGNCVSCGLIFSSYMVGFSAPGTFVAAALTGVVMGCSSLVANHSQYDFCERPFPYENLAYFGLVCVGARVFDPSVLSAMWFDVEFDGLIAALGASISMHIKNLVFAYSKGYRDYIDGSFPLYIFSFLIWICSYKLIAKRNVKKDEALIAESS